MQKVFIAVVLALALCSATAKYTVETANFIKAPVAVCAGNTTCLNYTTLTVSGISKGDVSIIGYNTPTHDKDVATASWKVFTAKLATKDLATSGNTTYTFTAPLSSSISQGYVFNLVSETADNVTNWFLYQTKLEGATVLPKVALTSNTNKNFTPSNVGMGVVGTSVFAGILVADKLVNVSTVTLGGSTVGKQITLTSAFPNTTSSVDFTTGDALSNKVLAVWTDGSDLKQSVVDFSKGTASAAASISGYNSTIQGTCNAFSTDKTIYGVVCGSHVNNTLNIFVATLNNNSAITSLVSLNDNSAIAGGFAYAGYLALLTGNATDTNTIYYKSIWNLDTKAAVLNATKLVSLDGQANIEVYRIPAGGVYAMLSNRDNSSVPRTDAVVGQILSGSFLTTVFGFLMTIVAGLLLF